MTTLLQVHAASTLAMTGLIWFVQVVHYPLFRFATESAFTAFALAHQRRTTAVVLPLMGTELVTAGLLAVHPVVPASGLEFWGLMLLAVIWLSTALIQVPLHRRLARGFDTSTARLLVNSNWIRTVAWSCRSVLALELLTT